MLIGEFRMKRDVLVAKAIDTLVEQTGWQRWFAKNVILWRKARGETLYARKVIS